MTVFNKQAPDVRWRDFNGVKPEAFHAAILRERPDLAAGGYHMPAQGCNGLTLVFEKEVFKCPQTCFTGHHGLHYLLREMAVLKFLEKHDVPFVPRLTHTAANNSFFGMTRMTGVPLAQDDWRKTAAGRERLMHEIVDVQLQMDAALHARYAAVAFPERLNHSTAVIADVLGDWHGQRTQKILALLSPAHRNRLDDYAARYPLRRPVFVHGDMNGGNILMDDNGQKVAAVIDVALAELDSAAENLFDYKWLGYDMKVASFNTYATRSPDPMLRLGDYACYEAMRVIAFSLRFYRTVESAARDVAGCFDEKYDRKNTLPFQKTAAAGGV